MPGPLKTTISLGTSFKKMLLPPSRSEERKKTEQVTKKVSELNKKQCPKLGPVLEAILGALGCSVEAILG